MHLPLRHDLYCAVVGAYVIWGAAASAAHVRGILQRAQHAAVPDSAVANEVQDWLAMLIRTTAMAFLGLIVVPFMAGLYLDLVMMPLRSASAILSSVESEIQQKHRKRDRRSMDIMAGRHFR